MSVLLVLTVIILLLRANWTRLHSLGNFKFLHNIYKLHYMCLQRPVPAAGELAHLKPERENEVFIPFLHFAAEQRCLKCQQSQVVAAKGNRS